MLSKHNHYVQTRERNLKTDGFAKLVRNKITGIMGGGGGHCNADEYTCRAASISDILTGYFFLYGML